MRRNQNRVMTALIAIAIATCLSACEGKQVGATVTGLNYRDDEISRFTVTDPGNDKNVMGGEAFLPYSVGGQMCCYALPARWHKGLQVKLDVKTSSNVLHDKGWEVYEAEQEERRKAGTLYQSVLLDIPEYHTQGTPTLWVQFLPGDRYAAIVSDAGPRDDAWPGEVKGWPEPTLEYEQKLWQREMRQAEDSLENANMLIEQYAHGVSDAQLQEKWAHYKKYERDELEHVQSYKDPEFLVFLKKSAKDYKKNAESVIDFLNKSKPT